MLAARQRAAWFSTRLPERALDLLFLLHVDVLEQLAALMDADLVIDVPNMRVDRMRRNYQLVRNAVHSIAPRDQLQDLAFTLGELELCDDLGADRIDLRRSNGCRSERDEARLQLPDRYQHERQDTDEDERGGRDRKLRDISMTFVEEPEAIS